MVTVEQVFEAQSASPWGVAVPDWTWLAFEGSVPVGVLTVNKARTDAGHDILDRPDAAVIGIVYVLPPDEGRGDERQDRATPLLKHAMSAISPRTLYGSGRATARGKQLLRKNCIDIDPEVTQELPLTDAEGEKLGKNAFDRAVAVWSAQ
ncbi:hypothetical protein NVV99_24330 [Rhodococcus sp. PAE-6]|uniref:hypothetical protein n=1 Tax=Rhodococcus sp. PAE-6 TaxID=2972477 RepID=UPI0021B18A8F|nr:hypothetical protein [Rhodococcus sp. PAE-6]MCT7294029.1 hypothetical protein [Rhodococcus sp. PAE-6]